MSTPVCFTGAVENEEDCLMIFHACRLGLVARFQRKLFETEKLKMVKSGSIFVWIEQETNLHRWTDGRSWSASRGSGLSGVFLLYREMLKRGGGRSRTAGAVEMRKSSLYESPERSQFRRLLRSLAGPLLNKGEFDELMMHGTSGSPKARDKFKRGGLIKKTYSLNMPGEKWHLVAYYSLEDALTGRLKTPRESRFFQAMSIHNIPDELWRASFSQRQNSDCAMWTSSPEVDTTSAQYVDPATTTDDTTGAQKVLMGRVSCDAVSEPLGELSFYPYYTEDAKLDPPLDLNSLCISDLFFQSDYVPG